MKIKISQLPLADSITGAEAVPIGQGGATVKTTAGDLIAQGTSNKSTSTLPFAMYSNNYMGVPDFGATYEQNKFAALAASTNPANFLNWQFIGGSVNGVNIPLDNPLVGSSITLTPSTVTFTNTPRGLVPNQYTTFINSILEGLNLVSRIVTSEYAVIPSDPDNNNGGRPYWNQMNYCDADTFFLLFQETGTIPGGPDMTIPYGFKSYNGLGGFNLYGYSVENLNDFQTMQNFLNNMNFGNNQSSFIQQLP